MFTFEDGKASQRSVVLETDLLAAMHIPCKGQERLPQELD